MGKGTLKRDIVAAEELFTSGRLEGGRLVIDNTSRIATLACVVIILTEDTRLLTSRQAKDALYGELKWARGDLLDRMPIKWTSTMGTYYERPGQALSTQFNRLDFSALDGVIRAGVMAPAIRRLRAQPTAILQELHGTLQRSMVESPPSFRLLGRRPKVSLDLVMRCLLLPYRDRQKLMNAWRTGLDSECLGELMELLRVFRELPEAEWVELERALR